MACGTSMLLVVDCFDLLIEIDAYLLAPAVCECIYVLWY